MLYATVDKERLLAINDSIGLISKVNYRANDTCLLVVNRFTSKENWHLKSKYKYVKKNKIDRPCYNNKLPLPNFWDSEYATNTETKLPKDFIIYVLNSKSGKYWDEKYLTSGKYMPKLWKSGYSKGVAISKKRNIIIYWFIIW